MDVAGIGALSTAIKGLVDKFIPDAQKAQELSSHLLDTALNFVTNAINAQRDTIVAEAKGESWLQRNWRPLTMLAFVGLIIAYWFGFTVENISEAERLALFDIIQIGLGGYVFGRSAEKIAERIAPAIATWGK